MKNPHQAISSAWAAVACVACWLSVGCGGAAVPSSASAANVSTVVLAEPERPPAIPEDLWLLVPADAMGVVELDLVRLRQWSHYPTLRRWLTQYGCMQDGEETALLDRIERGVAAITVRDPRRLEGVLLLRGAFTDADMMTIANAIDPELKKQQRGRWQVYADENDLVMLLDERTLVVAAGTWGDETIKLASATGGQHVRTAAFVQDLMPRVGAEGSLAVAMAAPSGELAKDVLRDLQRWGGSAAAIAKGLAAEPYWGARVSLQADNAGVTALGVASGGSEADATALIEATNSAFWQMGLLMRLIGMPPILSNANLQHAGGVATVGLQATGDEGATLLRRLEDVIKASAAPCTTEPAIATSPTP